MYHSPIDSSSSMSGDRAGMDTPTLVTALALLLFGFESAVVALIVAVLVMVVPAAMPGGTLNVNWNDAVAPALNVAMVQAIGPVPLQLNDGPLT